MIIVLLISVIISHVMAKHGKVPTSGKHLRKKEKNGDQTDKEMLVKTNHSKHFRNIKNLKLPKIKTSESPTRRAFGMFGYPCHRGHPLCTQHSTFQSLPGYLPDIQFHPPEEHIHSHNRGACKNGGVPVLIPGGYKCFCVAGYHGLYCQDMHPCYSNPCMNGGECVDESSTYKCRCAEGFKGYNCEAPAPCQNNPCKNGGTCVEKTNGFSCHCRPTFKGDNCTEVDHCTPNPCKNEGTCLVVNDMVQCKCQNNFKGRLCQEIKRCSEGLNPCKNGGICLEDNNEMPCLCKEGFKAPFCVDHVCDQNTCLNGGECIPFRDGLEWKYKCRCPHTFSGRHCHIPNPCAASPCLNDATCIDATTSFHGNPHGWDHTFSEYHCHCKEGFHGERCEISECHLCDMNADCIDKRCVCRDGYKGDGHVCYEIEDPCLAHGNPCMNGAMCITRGEEEFDCICSRGFTGPFCNETISCAFNPCKNGGTCVQLKRGYQCICQEYFTGDNCTIVQGASACASLPCLNGGLCRDKPGGNYECICGSPNFIQPRCECNCPKAPPFTRVYYDAPCDHEGRCHCRHGHQLTRYGCLNRE